MDTPDLRQLRYFVVLAEELHFSRAAERLGIAQPPLSQQIRKLERMLGAQLFVRGRKTQLTEPGTVLLDESRRILEQASRAVDAVRRAACGKTGRLTVGVPPSVMLSELPKAIRTYRERYPEVAFTLRELSTSAIEDSLRSGVIDIGFLREGRPAAPLVSEVILVEPVVAVLPASHRLTKRTSVAIGNLRGESFVLFPRRLGPAFYDRLAGFCADAGFVPKVVQEATQWQTVVSLVAAGLGVSLAPGCVRNLGLPGVAYRPVPGMTTAISASWRSGLNLPTVDPFLKCAKSILKAGKR